MSHRRKYRVLQSLPLLIAFAFLGAGCSGPFGYFPGGALEGEVEPVPGDWSGVVDYAVCQLETNPPEPYSVNIVCTVVDGTMYVNAGDAEKRWVTNMNTEPAVRVRIEDRIYEMRAERVTDEGEIARFGLAWTDQSMFRRDPAEYEQVYVYRLSSR